MQAFKVKMGPNGMVVISMEKSSEKHVSLLEGGPTLMQNEWVLKCEKLALPFNF